MTHRLSLGIRSTNSMNILKENMIGTDIIFEVLVRDIEDALDAPSLDRREICTFEATSDSLQLFKKKSSFVDSSACLVDVLDHVPLCAKVALDLYVAEVLDEFEVMDSVSIEVYYSNHVEADTKTPLIMDVRDRRLTLRPMFLKVSNDGRGVIYCHL